MKGYDAVERMIYGDSKRVIAEVEVKLNECAGSQKKIEGLS